MGIIKMFYRNTRKFDVNSRIANTNDWKCTCKLEYFNTFYII